VSIEPFEISIPDQEIAQLRDRLRDTRWSNDFNNDDWGYGVPESWLRGVVDYWVEGYDWRVHEAAMNRFHHFKTVIEDVPIHFIHERGRGRRTVPLVMSHGWPWTFWDFAEAIGPLSDPAAHGLSDEIAFDVVVTSLPGFGFSSPLYRSGVSAAVTADLWARLMREELGYDRFGAHGGDWGAFVTANLAHAHADKLIGAHLTMAAMLGIDFNGSMSSGRPFVTPADYAPDEAGWYERWTSRMARARAHSIAHRASPQTLAWAFVDSPVGLAAWILERRRNWSDNDGNVEQAFSMDFLLTTISIFHFTRTIGTSMRAYADFGIDTWKARHDRTPVMEAPVGLSVMPMDLLLLPRAMCERYANLVHWTVMPAGGHFAPSEQPRLIVDDIRAFFGQLV
jgi:pimeloyl-ACP methyl ester carboxylesterase